MDYKAYLSSLFYLTEAIKYLSPEQKAMTIHQIATLCREGFEETNVFGFKVYELFFERWPEITNYNKNELNKTKGTFFFRDNEMNEPRYRPRIFHGQNDERGEYESVVTLNLINGPVTLKSTFSEDRYQDDGEDEYSASWYLSMSFDNYKNYTEQDIRLLMDHIVEFLPNRE